MLSSSLLPSLPRAPADAPTVLRAVALLVNQARLCRAAGALEDALALLHDANALAPHDPTLLLQLGALYTDLGEPAVAATLLRRFLSAAVTASVPPLDIILSPRSQALALLRAQSLNNSTNTDSSSISSSSSSASSNAAAQTAFLPLLPPPRSRRFAKLSLSARFPALLALSELARAATAAGDAVLAAQAQTALLFAMRTQRDHDTYTSLSALSKNKTGKTRNASIIAARKSVSASAGAGASASLSEAEEEAAEVEEWGSGWPRDWDSDTAVEHWLGPIA